MEATKQPKVRAKNFFGPASVGVLIGLVISCVILYVIARSNNDHKTYLQYKEVFLSSLAGTKNESFSHIDPEIRLQALFSAEYFRKDYEAKGSIEELIIYLRAFGYAFDQLPSTSREEFAVLLLKTSIPPPLVKMAQYHHTMRLIGQEEDLKLVREYLSRTRHTIPQYDYQYPTVSMNLVMWAVFSMQCIGFLIFLLRNAYMRTEYDRRAQWYAAPWGKPGTYVALLLFLPGALPLIVFAGFLELCRVDFGEKRAKRRAAQEFQNDTAEAHSSLDNESDRQLLERLKKRMEVE